MVTNRKAVSTFLVIIIILCSFVVGAFISYMWGLANFYLEPETVDLAITEVDFPVAHADFFYVTVMNPSHSPSATNITEIYLTAEGDTETYSVTNTYPERLPIPIERGASKIIKCITNWGEFAGKTVNVHISGLNASGAMRSIKTEFVHLDILTYFNATESIRYFNITASNNQNSAINLTLTKVYFQNSEVANTTLVLPRAISIGETVTFQCLVNWEGQTRPLVKLETFEGYFAEIRKDVSSVAFLEITDVVFNETDSSKVSITFSNLESSTVPVDITDIVLTYSNKTEYLNGSLVNPALPQRLLVNSSMTFICDWNWTTASYRDINVTINAYTKQGFLSQFKTVKTPSKVVAKITEVKFDLDDTAHFSVNVTNMPSSLYAINVSKIMFNQNLTIMNSSIITRDSQASFVCGFNWTSFLGRNANVTVYIVYNQNQTSIPYSLVLPYYKIRDVSFSTFGTGNPYANVTIYNSNFSTVNATITKILIRAENVTYLIDGTITIPKISPNGYILTRGTEITIVCPWNWNPYIGKEITIIVQTADGFQASTSIQV